MTDQNEVLDVMAKLNADIEDAVKQLELLGKAPAPWFRVDVAMQTIIQFLFDSPELLGQFQLANAINVRKQLQAALEQAKRPQLLTPGS